MIDIMHDNGKDLSTALFTSTDCISLHHQDIPSFLLRLRFTYRKYYGDLYRTTSKFFEQISILCLELIECDLKVIIELDFLIDSPIIM